MIRTDIVQWSTFMTRAFPRDVLPVSCILEAGVTLLVGAYYTPCTGVDKSRGRSTKGFVSPSPSIFLWRLFLPLSRSVLFFHDCDKFQASPLLPRRHSSSRSTIYTTSMHLRADTANSKNHGGGAKQAQSLKNRTSPPPPPRCSTRVKKHMSHAHKKNTDLAK